MTDKAKPKPKGASAATAHELEVPDSAHDPDAATAAALVGTQTDPLWLAWLLRNNPRHHDALVAYLQQQLGMAFTKDVLEAEAGLQKKYGDVATDHSGSWADHLAAKPGEDRADVKGKPTPTERLPYDKQGGWDALSINSRLGQHDSLAGTDSDAARCTFAVALAGQIMGGPSACARWLVEFVNSHQPKAKGKAAAPSVRQHAAAMTLSSVADAIGAGTATFGDLSWAQEAMHAYLRTDDEAGGGGGKELIVPSLEAYVKLDSVHESAAEVMVLAGAVPDGGRLIVAVVGELLADDDSEAEAADGKGTKKKKDSGYYHQISIMKQGDKLYLYDPEWVTGMHLDFATATKLERYLSKKVFSSAAFLVQGIASPKAAAGH